MNILTKIKEKFSGGSDSFEFGLKGGLALIGIIGVIWCAEAYAGWRNTINYTFPLEYVGFWETREIEVISPIFGISEKTKDEVFDSYKLGPVLRSIEFLESTSGQNDGCKDEGKVNGFGYAQNGTSWKCYNTFEQVVEVVNIWFEERLSTNGNNISEAVCYYNTGVPHQDSCVYSQNFMSVIVDNL